MTDNSKTPVSPANATFAPIKAILTGKADFGFDYSLAFVYANDGKVDRNYVLHMGRVADSFPSKINVTNGTAAYTLTRDGNTWKIANDKNASEAIAPEPFGKSMKPSHKDANGNTVPSNELDPAFELFKVLTHMARVIYPTASVSEDKKARKADASLTDEQKKVAEKIRWDVAENSKVLARTEENKARKAAGLPELPAYVAKPYQTKAEKDAKKAAKPTATPAPVASSAPAQAIATNADARHAAHGKK